MNETGGRPVDPWDGLSSNVIPAAFSSTGETGSLARSIGSILIDAGRMSHEEAEGVLRYQRQHKIQFGDAAIKLGVVTQDDIDFALSQQFEYPYLFRGQSAVSEQVVAAYDPFSPQVEALRSLRTQLLLRLLSSEQSRSRLAIVSSEPGDGRSYLAANLAVVFSQLGEKTLLIDSDMRRPSQHGLFGIENRTGLSSVLSGRAGRDAIQRIPFLRGLSLLSAGPQPPNPQELLGRPIFSRLLDQESKNFDVIVLDTPAASNHSEAFTIASRAGAALLVARKDCSRVSRVRNMTLSMSQARIAMVGAVLNEF